MISIMTFDYLSDTASQLNREVGMMEKLSSETTYLLRQSKRGSWTTKSEQLEVKYSGYFLETPSSQCSPISTPGKDLWNSDGIVLVTSLNTEIRMELGPGQQWPWIEATSSLCEEHCCWGRLKGQRVLPQDVKGPGDPRIRVLSSKAAVTLMRLLAAAAIEKCFKSKCLKSDEHESCRQ